MANPDPERELARLHKELRSELPPVLVLSGASGFFRGEAFEAALAAVPDDAELRTIDGEQASADGDELQDLRGGSLFGRGTVLAVRRADGWMKRIGSERLANAVEAIQPGCHLLLECQKLDKRTKIGKRLAPSSYSFRDLYTEPYDRSRGPLDAEMVGWIVKRGSSYGVRLEKEAALLIMTVVGSDPAECVAELRRIADQVSGEDSRAALGPDRIRSMLTTAFESTPFEFVEALLDRDRPRVERALEAMFDRGVRDRAGQRMDVGGLFPFITSWAYTSLANALEGRRLLDSGVPPRELAKQCGVRVFQDRFVAQVQKNPAAHLHRGLRRLIETGRGLRTTGEDPLWLLRRFVGQWFAERGPAQRPAAGRLAGRQGERPRFGRGASQGAKR